ncbi:MAG: OB-fold domain-containing protein [Rhizobiaceae bacterium]|nr:OB-fold domain-containing protein [Rhizobiaceae bacterium]
MTDAYARLLPPITDANRGFWEGCAKGELRLQCCGKCKHLRYPDSPVCPRCLADESTWQVVSGDATLWSWVVMHQRYFEAFEKKLPYLVAFVKLEEGVFMTSTLVDPPDALKIDLPLRLEFIQTPAERVIPAFRVVQ